MSRVRVLPFRFLAAARYAPQWEEALEQAMLKCVAETEKLPGKTIVLVDVSGSMTAPLSRRSEMQRTDAAYGLAVLLREINLTIERSKLEIRIGLRSLEVHTWRPTAPNELVHRSSASGDRGRLKQ
jgi:hypothetical protein